MNEAELKAALANKDIDNMSDEEINETYDNLMSLTDDQVENIKNTAKNMRNNDPDAVLMEKIQNGELDLNTDDLKEQDKYAVIDPLSGKVKTLMDSPGGNENADIDDILGDDLKDIEDIEVTEENVRKGISELYGSDLNDSDVLVVLDLVKRFQDDGYKAKYDDLPSSIKSQIAKTIMEKNNAVYMGTKDLKDRMARTFIEEVSMQSLADKAQEIFVDLGTSINNYARKEISKSLSSITNTHSEMFTKKMLEFADKAESEGKTKEAEQLRNVSKAYTEACTLETMYNTYINTGKLKVKKFDIEKPQKVYQSMRDKYSKTKLTIRDVAMLEPILDRHLPEYIDMDDIKAFLIVFCKYCMNFSPSNIAEHTFMYYFIYNICLLDMCDETDEKSVEFRDNTIKTITKFIDLIRKRMGKE